MSGAMGDLFAPAAPARPASASRAAPHAVAPPTAEAAPPGMPARVLASWRRYLIAAHPLLPVHWPEGCGPARPDALCGCCRRAGWDLAAGWWLCRTCHP